MHKKNLIILFLLMVLAAVFVYPALTNSKPAGAVEITEVSANPSAFLGKLTISGYAGAVYAEEGMFLLVDEGGCCKIPLFVPFTQEQKVALEMTSLYTGTLPAEGDYLEASGTLKRENGYFLFDVDKVTRNGNAIISRAK